MGLEPGSRIRKTTETEVIPASPRSEAVPQDFYNRDFWEIIADIGRQRMWPDHLVRVYRADDRWDRAGSPENNKLTDSFNEETIRKNYGGGRYLLWLYGPPSGSKLVASPFKLELEGAPRGLTRMDPGAAGSNEPLMVVLQELLNEMRNSRGGNLAQDAMKNALEIQFQAMKQSLEMMRPAVPVAGSVAPSLMDGLLKELLTALIPALISKFTNPADPIESLGKVIDAVKSVSGIIGTGKAEKADTLGTVISALPGVLDKAVAGLREVRLSQEAQERAARLARGNIIDVQPTQPSSTAVEGAGRTGSAPESASDTPAAPAPPPQRELSQEETKRIREAIYLEGIMDKIASAIESDPECSGETLYEFLQMTAPQIIPQLKMGTREQIIAFFRGDGILSRVADHPKLPQIIDQFLEIAKAE